MARVKAAFGIKAQVQVRGPGGEAIRPRDGRGRFLRTKSCTDWNDLATDNFRNFLAALFGNTAVTVNFSLTDESNTARTLALYHTSGTPFNNTGLSNPAGCKIVLGDGSGSAVTPARSNYTLVNQLYEAYASAVSSGVGYITFSASFANSSGASQTIREVGVKMAWAPTSGSRFDFLILHDSVAATVVPNGSTVTCTYTVALPS